MRGAIHLAKGNNEVVSTIAITPGASPNNPDVWRLVPILQVKELRVSRLSDARGHRAAR